MLPAPPGSWRPLGQGTNGAHPLSPLSPLSLLPSLSSLHPRGEARPPALPQRNPTPLATHSRRQRGTTTAGAAEEGTATTRDETRQRERSREPRLPRHWNPASISRPPLLDLFHYPPPFSLLSVSQFHLTQRSLCATTGVTNLPPPRLLSRVSSHPACGCMLRASLALACVDSGERRGAKGRGVRLGWVLGATKLS